MFDLLSVSRVLCLALFFCLIFTSYSQELAWMRADESTNSNQPPNWSEMLEMEIDDAGNIYTTLQFLGSITIGDPANQVAVESTMGAATVVIKNDPDGNMLWYRLYPFLSNSRMKMDVSPNGSLLLVAEVRGDFDITFEGERLNPDPLTDYMFYLWLDTNGGLINWEFRDEIFEDFKLETLSDVLVFDDLTFWLAGGYAKEQLGENFTRHDIEFVSYFDTEAEPLQRNHFDPGERGEQEVDFLAFGEFNEVNGEIYFTGFGNGFYGLNDGDRTGGRVHAYLLKVNSSNTIDLVFGTTDVTDRLRYVLIHEDGSYSMVLSTEDGVLNTTEHDFNIGMESQFVLIHVKDDQLISKVEIPQGGGHFVPVPGRDDLVGFAGFALTGSSYEDGYGNSLLVPSPGPTTIGWVGLYNTDGSVEFIDFFDARSQDRVFITGYLPNSVCDGFLVGGNTLGAVDMNLGNGPPEFTPDYGRSRYFYAKYQNDAPVLEFEDEYVFCPDTEKTFELLLNDESISELIVSVSSPDGDFNPAQVSITGEGLLRTLDLTNVTQRNAYTLRVRVEDGCGEFTEKDVVIREAPSPVAPVLAQTGEYLLCPGDTLRLTATSDESLLWSEGSTSDTLKIFEAGDYWVKARAGLNCDSSNSDTLNVVMAAAPEMPEISANGPLILCPGTPLILTASLDERLVWSTGETSQSITVDQPGIYAVYQTSEYCGNSESSQVEVRFASVPEAPVIEVLGGEQVCQGDEVVLRSSIGANSRWSNGETGAEITVNASGSYWAWGFDGDCEGPTSEVVDIEVYERFTVELARDTTICNFFEPLELLPTVDQANLDFLWSDGSTGNSLIVNEPGNYWVEVSNGGCTELVQVAVTEQCLPKVFMPNAFSPNDDGENDFFAPVGQLVVDFQMQIYSQWGRLVFVSQDINQGWDGTFEGEKAPAGKYVYQVSYNGLINGELVSYAIKGRLDLIR